MKLAEAVDSANKDTVFVGSVMEERQYIHGIKLGAYTEGKEAGLAEGRAEGISEGEARGIAKGKAEGKTEGIAEGESRMSRLAAKMQKTGATLEEVVAAMSSPDKDALFAKYGV